MLRFAHTIYLWGLAAIPVFVLLFWLVTRWKKKAMTRLGDRKVIDRIIPEVSFSRPWLKFIFFMLAYACMVLAVADPQLGLKMEEEKRKSADLMILLDVSN